MAYKTDEPEIFWTEPAPITLPPREVPEETPVEVPEETPEREPVPV